MTTYTKETALYDTGAISSDIESASETASKFLSADSSGIMVYDGENGIQYPSTVSSGTKNVFIDDNSMDIRDGTTALASFGEQAVIGKNDEFQTIVSSTSMSISNGDDTTAFSVNATGDTRTIRTKTSVIPRMLYHSTVSSKPADKTSTYEGSKYFSSGTTYTLYIGLDSEQVITWTPTNTSTATVTNTYTGTVTRTLGGTTYTSDCTVVMRYIYKNRTQSKDGTYRYYWHIRATTTYSYSGESNDWVALTPATSMLTDKEINVSNVVINDRTYQLEDLFGTSTVGTTTEYIDLGQYHAMGYMSSTCGTLGFSFPTGRVFPEGTTISRVTFNLVVRSGSSNGTGKYSVKSASGGTSPKAFDSTATFSFYNAADQSKSIATSKMTCTLQGRTNVSISLATGTDYFFSGNSTNTSYINNQPQDCWCSNIKLYVDLPTD